jgi:hypothetical protein
MKVWHLALNGGTKVKNPKDKAKARIAKNTKVQMKLTFQKVAKVQKGVVVSDDEE